ncbi:MAG TPA: tetratricopeptide repeat protein [Alphaproteobacteria bacterium]|nr:tetratricopeptide repeat protein [Alphaproteobacteria bacterium]
MAGAPVYGIVGALTAFPRRLAAREVARQGGVLRGGARRRITHLIFGRTLLGRMAPEAIARRRDDAVRNGVAVLSENGFRRALGLLGRPEAGVARASLIEQSRLDGTLLDLLSLFDAFEADSEPYSFRDVILARKYAKLSEAGSGWADIARSVHRSGNVASLTAVALHAEGGDIFRRDGEHLSEIDGQGRLPFAADEDHEAADALFTEAEAAEAAGKHAAAAALYARYLAAVPTDAVAAFNRANCLAAAGEHDEAATAYALAIKLDPNFAEAWFNHGTLLRDMGRPLLARQHFETAAALDPGYADPVYNLAALAYDAGELHEARRLWSRYLELDATSEWARKASRGIQLIDMTLHAQRQQGA